MGTFVFGKTAYNRIDMVCKHLDTSWPVGANLPRHIPQTGEPGSFWEDRGDRHHAGVDLYAPVSSPVLAIQASQILRISVHTSPGILPFWNTTYAIILQLPSGIILRYAELGDISVSVDQVVKCGQVLGYVGQVLLPNRVIPTDPEYIHLLKDSNHSSMLHLEAYVTPPLENDEHYVGGSYVGLRIPPAELIDPTSILEDILRNQGSQAPEYQVY